MIRQIVLGTSTVQALCIAMQHVQQYIKDSSVSRFVQTHIRCWQIHQANNVLQVVFRIFT